MFKITKSHLDSFYIFYLRFDGFSREDDDPEDFDSLFDVELFAALVEPDLPEAVDFVAEPEELFEPVPDDIEFPFPVE